jgi:hypothetical protein
MTRTAPCFLLAGLLLLTSTCTRKESASPPPALEMGVAPTLEIGDDRLPDGHELTRVTDVRRLPDGAMMIANSGSHELLHFDRSGTFLRAIGRRGKGPGEFLGTLHLFSGHHDSLLVFDDVNLRGQFSPPQQCREEPPSLVPRSFRARLGPSTGPWSLIAGSGRFHTGSWTACSD